MRQLDIWLESADIPIGHLVADDFGRLAFAYSNAWLDHPRRHTLSLSLPLTGEIYTDNQARPFFENLLIENGLRRREIARNERIEEDDVAAMLYHMGADCAGAVSCLPFGAAPAKRPGDLNEDYDRVDEQKLQEIISAMAFQRPLPGEMHLPSPVAGLRDKICVARLLDGTYAFPKKGSGVPTTHILKVPDRGSENEPLFEAKCAELAVLCGFDVAYAKAETIEVHDGNIVRAQNYLVIERFDRIVNGDGTVYRVHQEDFAQALGLPRDMKYEHHGSDQRRYCVETIAALLDATDSPIESKRIFLKASFFNLAVGNWNNHAKNHALLHYGGKRPMMAPLYDMVPIPLEDRFANSNLAFRIGNASLAREILSQDFDQLFERFGFTERMRKRFITDDLVPMLTELDAVKFGDIAFRKFDALIGRELDRINNGLGLRLELREREYLPEGRAGGWALS